MMMIMLVVEVTCLVREAVVTVSDLIMHVVICAIILLTRCHSRLVMTVYVHRSALPTLCYDSTVLASVALTTTAGSKFL